MDYVDVRIHNPDPNEDTVKKVMTAYNKYDALLASHDKLLNKQGYFCAFCSCETDKPTTIEEIQKHVEVCEFHPYGKMKQSRDALVEALQEICNKYDERPHIFTAGSFYAKVKQALSEAE